MFYDCARTPDPSMSQLLFNRSVRRDGFPDDVLEIPEIFFSKHDIWQSDGLVAPPVLTQVATLMRLYMLARADVMLVHLDVAQAPEMWQAAMVGIPVIGVSERHTLYPVVLDMLTVLVRADREAILKVIRGLGGRT